MTKTQNSLVSKILLIALSVMLALSCFVFSGCTPKEEGISLQSSFQTAYVKGEKIMFNGSEVTNMPNLDGGQIKYVFKHGDKYYERIIDLKEAALNYANTSNDLSKDRIKITGFNTTGSSGTMKLELFPSVDKNNAFVSDPTISGSKNLNIYLSVASVSQSITPSPQPSSTLELDINYKIYKDGEALAGAEQTTKILYKINDVLQFILVPLMSVVLTLGIFFVIILVANMAKANNGDQRAEAKKRIVYVIVAIAVSAALIVIFQLFSSYSLVWFEGGDFFTLG